VRASTWHLFGRRSPRAAPSPGGADMRPHQDALFMLLYCPQFCKPLAVSSLSVWPASDAARGQRRSHPLVMTVGWRTPGLPGVTSLQPLLPPPCGTPPLSPPQPHPLRPSSPSPCAVARAWWTPQPGSWSTPLISPRCAAASPCSGCRAVAPRQGVRGGSETVRGLEREAVRGLRRNRAWFGESTPAWFRERGCVVSGEAVRALRRNRAWFEGSKSHGKAYVCMRNGVRTLRRLSRRLSTRQGVSPCVALLWRSAA
jgi:hypothetical protein